MGWKNYMFSLKWDTISFYPQKLSSLDNAKWQDTIGIGSLGFAIWPSDFAPQTRAPLVDDPREMAKRDGRWLKQAISPTNFAGFKHILWGCAREPWGAERCGGFLAKRCMAKPKMTTSCDTYWGSSEQTTAKHSQKHFQRIICQFPPMWGQTSPVSFSASFIGLRCIPLYTSHVLLCYIHFYHLYPWIINESAINHQFTHPFMEINGDIYIYI